MQRDFHSLSVKDQLYRLAEVAKQPYRRSSRERRACVALIFRLATPHTPVQSPPTPHASSPLHPPSSSSSSTPLLSASPSPSFSPSTSPSSPPLPPDPIPSLPPPPPFPPTGYSRYISPTPSYPRLISQLHSLLQSPLPPSTSLQLLFIQRALNPHDRWSGQMALPGGRQQRGESDFLTAVREVHEELGLSLWDDTHWLYIGRMDDRHIESFGGVKPLAVCPFLFLQRSPDTPRMALQTKEVNAVVFTPLSFFTDPALRWDYLVHPLVRTWTTRMKGKRRVEVGYKVRKTATAAPTSPSSPLRNLLPSLTSLSSVHFPALALPGYFETADGRHGVSLRDTLLYQHTAEEQRQRQQQQRARQVTAPPAPVEEEEGEEEDGEGEGGDEVHSELLLDVDIEPGTFVLWGFTLVLLSDLLLSLQCSSLSAVIERGQKDRQRTLRLLYRSIDVMDGLEKRWKGWKDTTGRWIRELRGDEGKDGEGETGQAGGVDVSVHRDVVAAASSEEETQRRKEEVDRRQRASAAAPVSKL